MYVATDVEFVATVQLTEILEFISEAEVIVEFNSSKILKKPKSLLFCRTPLGWPILIKQLRTLMTKPIYFLNYVNYHEGFDAIASVNFASEVIPLWKSFRFIFCKPLPFLGAPPGRLCR